MKIYAVFGVEYHIGRDLLGVYDSLGLAVEKKNKEEKIHDYDNIIILEIELNKDIVEE